MYIYYTVISFPGNWVFGYSSSVLKGFQWLKIILDMEVRLTSVQFGLQFELLEYF